MNNTKTIMLVGVGGQGTLLASRVLGQLFLGSGYDVKVSEVHGMSQRGGSVVTYIRWGECVNSPVINEGEADYIISFELCEAARWSSHLKADGTLITGSQQILPMPVITGAATYPQNVEQTLKSICKNCLVLDALSPAVALGNSKAVNMVLMGVLSRILDIDTTQWHAALAEAIKPSLLALNMNAFEAGRALYDTTVKGGCCNER
ncbi:MAG: indolepyruvate oxidoreductase subunit beta [Angelakisella sp.]